MQRTLKFMLGIVTLTLMAGCQSDSGRQSCEAVSGTCVNGRRIVDYVSDEPALEPTLRVGGILEVRTTNGGPVMFQSQVNTQRKAAERQQRENDAPAAVIETK